MPKKIHKIDQFHGGLNSNSDPRDIADNELAAATDIMVDELGRIRTLGRFIAHDAYATSIATVEPGYGLFQFSHDRTGADVAPVDLYGSHTEGDSGTRMEDEIADFPVDGLIGATITNLTDGSSGTITDNTATQIDVAALAGGTNNDWEEPNEMIAEDKDMDFSAASNWVQYSPVAANPSFGDSGSPAKLVISDNTGATGIQGAELGTGYFADLIPYKTYRVSAKIWSASSTIDNFKIELGGVASESFTISTSEVPIVKDIKVNADAELRIYFENASAVEWYVDDVSVTQIDTYRITNFPETGEDYIALVDSVVFTDATCDYNNDPTIAHDANVSLVGRAGISVSGDGIPEGAYIKTINSPTSFELSVATTGGIYTHSTLTFGGGVRIYARNTDSWSPGSPIKLGDTTEMKPSFYYVDGALRISDGNFGLGNEIQWYGYIKRKWFPNLGGGYDINEWHQTRQSITPPGASYFKKDWIRTTGEAEVSYLGTYANQLMINRVQSGANGYRMGTKSSIEGDLGEPDQVLRAVLYYSFSFAGASSGSGTVNIKAGFWNDVAGWSPYAQEHNVFPFQEATHATQYVHEWYFDPATTDVDEENLPGPGNTDYFRFEVTYASFPYGSPISYVIMNQGYVVGAAATIFPDLHPAGTSFTYGHSTGNNVCMLWAWNNSSDSGVTAANDGWVPLADSGLWSIGATFIYDGNQESQMTILIDEIDNSIDGMNLTGMNALTSAEGSAGGNVALNDRPAVVIAIADPNHDGDGESDGTSWNKRVTGCNIYLRNDFANEQGTTSQAWFLQYSCDFTTGKLKVESSQAEFDVSYHKDATAQSYYYWFLDTTHSKRPASLVTYEMNTGYDSTEEDTMIGYKTAVVANRIAYVGNAKVQKADGSSELLGDAMIKSFVGKFDTFPLSRIIEASVRDGDEIVKLEEYADRILQFKKNKMHLINVSQELEFLEETFTHKGVSHPAATCKTDFGIAWVNRLGCYLYDGKNVTNLLEKGGRQIIKESEWDSFTTEHSIIGYIPKKRQLMVLKNARGKFRLTGSIDPGDSTTTVPGTGTLFLDEITVGDSIVVEEDVGGQNAETKEVTAIASNTSLTVASTFSSGIGADTSPDCIPQSSEGDIYLYDMVTQSWVRGDGVGSDISASGFDVAVKSNFTTDWNGDLINAYALGGGLIDKWADASYLVGNADIKTKDIDFGQPAQRKKIYRVRISYKGDADQLVTKFSVNGDTDTLYQFINPDSGSADDTPLADKTDITEWHHAELKPATSSEANNVYSFQLHMSATVDLDFEINDISIVYRLKGVK